MLVHNNYPHYEYRNGRRIYLVFALNAFEILCAQVISRVHNVRSVNRPIIYQITDFFFNVPKLVGCMANYHVYPVIP